MTELYKSRIAWLEDLSPPRSLSDRFLVSHPIYRAQELTAVQLERGRFRMEEHSETEFELVGDTAFYRTFARALLYIAEGKDRLILLDKRKADARMKTYPRHDQPVSRSVVIAHHTLQLKRSDAGFLWRNTPTSTECSWSRDTWDTSNLVWKKNCLDVRLSRDTVYLTGSTAVFVEMARVAVAMSRNPTYDHYRLYVLHRNEHQPFLTLFKPGPIRLAHKTTR